MSGTAAVLSDAFLALRVAAAALAFSVLLFGFLALALKGRAAIDAAVRAVAEVRLNLAFYFFDALFVAPIVTVIIAGLRFVITQYSLTIASEQPRSYSSPFCFSVTSSRTGAIGWNTRACAGLLTSSITATRT